MNAKTKLQCVSEGLQTLLEYGGIEDIAAEHDEIYAGTDNASIEAMIETDRQKMIDLGWDWDELYECWHIFV